MNKRKQIEEILFHDYGRIDEITVNKLCALLDVSQQRELLPKRLSNEAYKKAKALSYEDFVSWWDEQV